MALVFIVPKTSDVFIYLSLSFTKWFLKEFYLEGSVNNMIRERDLWEGGEQNKGDLFPHKGNQCEGSKESIMKNAWHHCFYQFYEQNVLRYQTLTVAWKNLQNNYSFPHPQSYLLSSMTCKYCLGFYHLIYTWYFKIINDIAGSIFLVHDFLKIISHKITLEVRNIKRTPKGYIFESEFWSLIYSFTQSPD